jgi:hypothetical protein
MVLLHGTTLFLLEQAHFRLRYVSQISASKAEKEISSHVWKPGMASVPVLLESHIHRFDIYARHGD